MTPRPALRAVPDAAADPPADAPANAPHRVVVLAYPGVQALGVAGAQEVLSAANTWAGQLRLPAPYAVTVAGPEPMLTCSTGLVLAAAPLPDDVTDATVVVPGGEGIHGPAAAGVVEWLAGHPTRRLATQCAGAFLAARAGLLDGRTVATHWAYAARLRRQHPRVRVLPDAVHHRDGPVWSSGGATTGMDLMLALVAQDCGALAAQTVARWLVTYVNRPGNQRQFAATRPRPRARDERIAAVQDHVEANPSADLRVETLAQRARMSPRHFQREFHAQTGVPVGQYVASVRLDHAKHRLTGSDEPVAVVARQCGLGSAESLRRAFVGALDTTPSDYRRRFRVGAG